MVDLYIVAALICYFFIGVVVMRVASNYNPDFEGLSTVIGWPLFLVLMLLYRLIFGRWDG